MFQEPRFSYPIFVLEGQGCGGLSSLPIATVNVMTTNDHGRNWCMDHSHGERGSGIWHDSCARLRACQMSGWLRRHSNVLPTLSKVKGQRLLRQKRCYWLLDDILCNRRRREGKGLDWIADNCSKCRGVRCIFDQTVSYREWQVPLLHGDDEPHNMWAWNPLSKNSHH